MLLMFNDRSPSPTSLRNDHPTLYNLGIDGCIAVAKHLNPELVMLAVPAGLGTFVSKDRTQVIQPHRLGQIVHAMLQVGPAYRSCTFGAQSQKVSTPILEGIGFLFDDVGNLPNAPDKQASVLKHGRVDTPVSKPGSNFLGLRVNVAPVILVAG